MPARKKPAKIQHHGHTLVLPKISRKSHDSKDFWLERSLQKCMDAMNQALRRNTPSDKVLRWATDLRREHSPSLYFRAVQDEFIPLLERLKRLHKRRQIQE